MNIADRPWRHDLKLIEAARAGEEEALLTLLQAAQPDIRRYAARSCRSADDVDDAVQETLWILYRRVGTIRTLTSISGWLVTVVRRECARLAQKIFHTKLSSVETLENDLRWSARSPVELQIDMAQAIRSLPEHYRQAVWLRDFEEMSIDEIASKLALTRESAKARLHRARNMIREYLKD